jgi:hypothetical protein
MNHVGLMKIGGRFGRRESIVPVCRTKRSDLGLDSNMDVSDMPLSFGALDVHEAFIQIERQRELIVELMHLGQPTEGAEELLKILLGRFATMVEHEHTILAEALDTAGTA